MTFLNRHRSRIRPVGPFAPSSLFFGGIPGAWYDPTDLSTMFQDSAGTTPVTAVEQPVGLILDKSQGLALGSDIVVNGNFASAAGWLTPGSWTIGSGVATASGGGYLYRTLAAVSGYKVFRVTFDLVTRTAGSVQAYMHNGTTAVFTPAVSAPGSYSFVLAHTNVNELGFLATALTGSVDNLSIRELAGNHASQSTAASRPTYRARYNLLTYSEQFNNAAWVKAANVSVTPDAIVAPDGTTTADLVTATAGDGFIYQTTSTLIVGTTYTFSVWLRSNSPASFTVALQIYNGTDTGGAQLVTVTNTWQRFTITKTVNQTNTYLVIIGGTVSGSQTFDNESMYAWGAQLLTAADVTATGNAYQRIAAATVYDTAPIFRPYLAFDGMDDSLSTAAINFTATDKMSVFSGVTKNTDGSAGCVAELSATAITNNGSFALFSSAGGAVWYVAGRGTALGSFACATFTAPITNTISSMIDIAQPALASELIPRINTTVNQTGASGTDIGTGNFGNWPLYIGRRGGTTLPFNGRLFSLIVRGAASSVTEIADTELWVNARTGAY